MQREHHYFEFDGTHEYWECPHDLSDWYKVDREIGSDWHGDTYRYARWSHEPNMRKDNYPPRISW